MKVLLIQLDGSLPNLALLRIAAHHRALGDCVEFSKAPYLGSRYDRIYASAIFKKSAAKIELQRRYRPDAIIGGTGIDVHNRLSDIGITTQDCDYSIYPEFRSSIGYTQRGCRLNCSFCGVPEKEGKPNSPVSVNEIWRGDGYPRELFLLDNDFFGLPQWRDRIKEIRDGKFKVSFNQGVNVRLMDEEQCEAVASVDYRDGDMDAKRFYTAWDNRKDESILFRGLNWLAKYGMKPDHIMVYMLCGYCHTHKAAASLCNCPDADSEANREYRRHRLREFGARPYPMPFERTKELIGFQRFVVRRIDCNVSWADFKAANYRPEGLAVSA